MLKQSRSIMSLQSGKGDFPVYRGVSRQYGNGLGSIFKAALRTVIPILKPVAKASLKSVKKVAKDQGVQALKDIVGGENVKKVLKQRGKTALKSFGTQSVTHYYWRLSRWCMSKTTERIWMKITVRDSHGIQTTHEV